MFQVLVLQVGNDVIWVHVTLLLTGLAAFVLPLTGMRRKLIAERATMLSEVDQHIERKYAQLKQQIGAENKADFDEPHKALQALRVERAAIEKISTWPWDTNTLRGFASTFMLPILLWLITRLLERLF